METTMDLLDAALEETGLSARALSMKLGHSPWTLNRARERASLSPGLAGELAAMLHLNIAEWMAIAALENEPDSRTRARLFELLQIQRVGHPENVERIEWNELSRKTPGF